jgi:hypothetical protein
VAGRTSVGKYVGIPPLAWALFVGTALIASIVSLLFSLWCSLFGGPPWSLGVGALGFVVMWSILFFGHPSIFALKRRMLGPSWPGLCSRVQVLAYLRRPFEYLLSAICAVGVLSIVVLFSSARLGGVIEKAPVFAKRESYELRNHQTVTQVSRFRYILVGASFFVGWHAGALFFSLTALHYLLFGEPPKLRWRSREWPMKFG